MDALWNIRLFATLLPVSAQAASKSELNKAKVIVCVSGSVTLGVKGASSKFTSSTKNKKIAMVNKSGKVIGKKSGKTMITARVNKKSGKTMITARVNKKSVRSAVTVKNPCLKAKSKA